MTFYTDMQEAALSLLTELDQTVQLRRLTISEPANPWEKPTFSATTYNIYAVADGIYGKRADGNEMVVASDVMVIMAASGAPVTPQINDIILLNSKEHRIVWATPIPADASLAAAYEIAARLAA